MTFGFSPLNRKLIPCPERNNVEEGAERMFEPKDRRKAEK